MTMRKGVRMILGSGAMAVGLAGCLFLSPDSEDDRIVLRIEASVDTGAMSRLDCTILQELNVDSELTARATVRLMGDDEALATKIVPVTYDPSSENPLKIGDLEFLRAGPDDSYMVDLELFYTGDDPEGTFTGTFEDRGASGLSGCVRGLRVANRAAFVDVCAAGSSDDESRMMFLNARLQGEYRQRIVWPPGSPDPNDSTDVIVVLDLDLLPVRIAAGSEPIDELSPSPDDQTVSIRLTTPRNPPRCPGDDGEEMVGTLAIHFVEGYTEPAVADVYLIRNADCGCCSECD